MAKKKAKPKPNSGNPPKLEKSRLVLIWIPIITALIGAAATILVVFLPSGELPTIIFEVNPPLEQAREKVDEGNDGDALPLIEEAITLDPTNPQSYMLEAEIMLRLDRQPEAVQALDSAAKAVPKPLRKTMRDTRAQVKKSPVDGYIGISTTYEKFGLRDIAIALLERVCKELPQEGRLREALGRLVGEPETQNVLPVEIPDNVFTLEDAKAFGVTWESDPYQLADRFGISRSEVDRALIEAQSLEEGYCTSATKVDSGVWLMFARDNEFLNNGFYGVEFIEGYSGSALPHNTYIGMNIEQLIKQFYYEDERVFEELKQPQKGHDDSTTRFMIYDYNDSFDAFVYTDGSSIEQGRPLRYRARNSEGYVEVCVDWDYASREVTRITILFGKIYE